MEYESNFCPFMTSVTCIEYHRLTGMKEKSCPHIKDRNSCDLVESIIMLARLGEMDIHDAAKNVGAALDGFKINHDEIEVS